MDINDVLKREIEKLDFEEIAANEIRKTINKEVLIFIKNETRKCAGEMVVKAALEVFQSETVISDGWNSKTFKSFEEFLKDTMQQKMQNTWAITSELRKWAEAKMEKTWQLQAAKVHKLFIKSLTEVGLEIVKSDYEE